MKRIYFKTIEAMEDFIRENYNRKDYYVSWCPVQCACGQSEGARIYTNEDFKEVQVLVLCDACHESADNFQKGE